MFETSQQEQGSGSSKTVAVVIAVMAVVLVAVYFLFLKGQTSESTPANKPAVANTTGEKPDAMKDLQIVKSTLHRDQTQTMAMWDIQVANRSKSIAYKNLKYATNYYNNQDAVIYHNEGTLSDPVEPADQHGYASINDGLYPVGTTRYTIELKGADAVQ